MIGINFSVDNGELFVFFRTVRTNDEAAGFHLIMDEYSFLSFLDKCKEANKGHISVLPLAVSDDDDYKSQFNGQKIID